MNVYGNRNNSVSDRLPRSRVPSRRDSTGTEANTNGNNSKKLDSYINNYTRSTENSNRTSTSRMPGGLRMKSNLVGSMTATFEQLNKDTLPPPGPSPTIKSSSFNRLESSSITSTQKLPSDAAISPRLENGTSNTNHVSKPPATPRMENGTSVKKEMDNDDADRTPSRAKSSASARRGKTQREKRMLRQKRRSTGVVRLKGSDDEEEGGKKEEKEQNDEKDDEAIRKTETEKNTISNEFSPPSSSNYLSAKSESERSLTHEPTEGSSMLKKSATASNASSPSHTHQTSDNVFLSGDSTPQSPNMPMLNSSRRRGKRGDKSNDNQDLEELRTKLETAESTIGKLTKEIEEMETDIKHLAEENQKLKHENKLLEDENTSMLMVLKQLRNSRE